MVKNAFWGVCIVGLLASCGGGGSSSSGVKNPHGSNTEPPTLTMSRVATSTRTNLATDSIEAVGSYKYRFDGMLIAITREASGTEIEYLDSEYLYNSQGLLYRINNYNDNGEISSHSELTYSEQGLVLSNLTYMHWFGDVSMGWGATHTYDENGTKITTGWDSNADGEADYILESVYENGLEVGTRIISGEGWFHEMTYNSLGQRISIIGFDSAKNERVYENSWIYNDKGQISSAYVDSNGDGTDDWRTDYTYEDGSCIDPYGESFGKSSICFEY